MIDYKNINPNEGGLSVRAKINNMFASLISGSEGVNNIWAKLFSLFNGLKSVKVNVEEIHEELKEQVLQSFDHTDVTAEDLRTYINCMNGGVSGFAVGPSFKPDFPEGKSVTVLAVGAGTYEHFLDANGNPITIQDEDAITIFYRGASSTYWQYKSTYARTGVSDGAVTTEKLANSAVTSEKLMDNAVGFSKLSDYVKNIGLNYITISTLNTMTPVDLAPSCLANNPTKPLRSIVVHNDIVIGYVDTYSDGFGFIILQTFNTRANIDADGTITSYDNNIIHTYTRSGGVSDTTWSNKWSKTSIEENSSALFGFLPWGSKNNGPDNLDFSAILDNKKPLTYYMTRVVSGENVVVGVLQCYSDSMLHGFVQIYESIEALNSEGKFDGSHNHTELKKYSRYYDGHTFTAWKEIGVTIGDGSITEVKLSDSVKNLLLHRIDWSNLHTAKLGKYIVTNNDIPVGYVNTLSLNNSYQVQIFTTTMVYDEENVTFVSGTSYSKINTYIRRYSIEYDEWDDWEDFTDSGESGGIVTVDATYKPILPGSTVITNSVGGIKPGTTISSLSGKTFSQVLEMMLVSESWNNPNYTHNISVSTPESPVKVGSTAVPPAYNATWNSNIQSDSEKEIYLSFNTNLNGTVYKKAGTYTYTITYSYPAGYYTITSNLGNTKRVTVPSVSNATITRSVIATYPWFINNTEQALVAIGSSKTVEVELTGSPSIKVPFTNSKVTIQADLGFGWMDVSWDESVDNSNLGNATDETVPYKVYTKPDSYASPVKHKITIKLSK